MSIISGTSHSSGDFYDYPIEQSLRFDGSSYLYKSFSNTSTSRRQQTFSFWVKPSVISGNPRILFIRSSDGTTQGGCYISSDKFKYFSRVNGTGNGDVNTNMIVRDFSAWYHVVFKIDHTNTSVEIYVNGVSQSLTTNFAIVNSDNCFFTTSEVNIGREPVAGGSYFNGYLANIQFLDGTVPTTSNGGLDASTGELKWFGETKSGVWVPKAYTGDHGTNGFHLKFALADFYNDSNNNNQLMVEDVAPIDTNHSSSNDWEVH